MDLRQFRNNRGLQRKFVASKIKISGKHLNDIEAGRVNLTDKVALRFSHLYSVNIQKLSKCIRRGKMNNLDIINRQLELIDKIDNLQKKRKEEKRIVQA